jgi:hypothetical protein
MTDELSSMVLGLTVVAGIIIVGLFSAEIYHVKNRLLKN